VDFCTAQAQKPVFDAMEQCLNNACDLYRKLTAAPT
jgi:hypothetical protein